jgi:hypothetical protein
MDLRGAALNFDIKRLNPFFLADPFPVYRAPREHDPVHRMPDGSYMQPRSFRHAGFDPAPTPALSSARQLV